MGCADLNVRLNHSEQPECAEAMRRRDASDLQKFIEYVRRSLIAVSETRQLPRGFPAPDERREDPRISGFRPAEGAKEPDLTDWQLRDRLVGKATFTTGEVRWYGPSGAIVDLPTGHVKTDAT